MRYGDEGPHEVLPNGSVRYTGKLSPLPENYFALPPELQRAARINAIQLRVTPEDMVRGWEFFRSWYLFDQAGFYKRRVKSPPCHYHWIYYMSKYARNVIAAPRAFAKSIVVGQEFPMYLMLGKTPMDILVVVSEKRKAELRGQRFMHVFSQNPRVSEDFGDLKGRPRTDERLWNFTRMDLSNGSSVTCTSILSRQLGARPDYIIWDDIEPDPERYRDWEAVVEGIIDSLFNVYLPMLDGGTAMTIIGTLLHRKSFLYWIYTTKDPRLGFWHRSLTAIVDENGKPEWEEKFPLDVVKRLEKELGSAAFAAQYMNAPRSEEDALLEVNPYRNGYKTEGVDFTCPMDSDGSITVWSEASGTVLTEEEGWKAETKPWKSFLRDTMRFIAVDWAEGLTDQHDFSCVMVLGLDREDRLYALDIWLGRITVSGLADIVWNMAEKWKVRTIGVESVSIYRALFERLALERKDFEARAGWVPGLKAVKYPHGLSKASRIASLQWRFENGLIRLPIDRQDVPAWRALFRQIRDFTMDLKNLRHDDAVDTLAMHKFIVEGSVSQKTQAEIHEQRKTFVQRILDGESCDPVVGVPYVTGMRPEEIPYREVREREAKIAVGIDPDLPEGPGNRDIRSHVLARVPTIFTLSDLDRAIREVLKEEGEDDVPNDSTDLSGGGDERIGGV